jgi:ABC-type antimicrobial peptide transport system permease subunit
MSVTTIIGLGEGVKKQVNQQINELGGDIITITPGRTQKSNGISNLLSNNTTSTASRLTENDLSSVEKLPNINSASGVMKLDGSVSRPSKGKVNSSNILAVDDNYLNVTAQKIVKGQFFGGGLENNDTAILASNLSKQLFGDEDPIGSTIAIRGKTFIVVGVLDTYKGFNFGQPINDHVLIPLPAGKEINRGNVQLQQFNIKLKDSEKAEKTAKEITRLITKKHSGEEDFTVTTQEQLASTTDDVFKVLTGFTAAIASISLLVGGIGVMNIMLVTVTERTREIGIRKAVGATRFQIMMQFLTEALIITLAGGFIGIILSVVVSYIIRLQTAIKPSLDIWVIMLAAVVSLIVGVIFGTWPAIRAARKDPIEALRHD